MTSCSWKAKLGTLHMEKNYLITFFTFVCGAEGDGAMSPSFVVENEAIEASSSSLEGLIATRCSRGDVNGGIFSTANKMPVCQSLSVYKRREQRGNVALF